MVNVLDHIASDVSRVLERMEHLLSAYPRLFHGGIILPVFGMFVATGRDSEQFPISSDLAWPVVYLCYCGSFACLHLYDLSRQRIQKRAQQVSRDIRIGQDCCFTCSRLQDSYERWLLRSLLWKSLDWLSAAHMIASHFRLLFSPHCGGGMRGLYQLWAGIITSTVLVRLILRKLLPPALYSALSLAVCAFIWATHSAFLIAGDECFGALAQGSFTGRLASRSLISCSLYSVVSLITPVTQRLSHVKTGVVFVGCTITCYLHIISRDGQLDLEVDAQRWSFSWLFLCIWLCSALSFCGNTLLNEAGMFIYLASSESSRTT